MRIVILGSGSIVPDALRFASSIYLESKGTKVLLDCGPGTLEKMRGLRLSPNEIDVACITHYHIDHVSDLLPLIKLRAFSEDGGPAGTSLRLV